MSIRYTRTAVVLIFSLVLTAAVCAVEITPDSGFDGDGLAITKIGAGKDEAKAIVIQDDGKIVVGGQSGHPDISEMAVIRYLPDGSVDHDFLFSGGQQIGAGFGSDAVRSLQIDSEGRIIVGGFATENGSKFGALVRLLSDGRLDYDFGEQGVVLFSDDANESDFYDIQIVSEERILAGGSNGSGIDVEPLFVRFNPDGSIDETFGTKGLQVVPDFYGEVHGIAVSEDGSVIGGGYALDEQAGKQLLLVKLTGQGQMADAFGNQGSMAVTNVDEELVIYDIGLLPDDKMVAVGETISDTGASSSMVSRFLADGSPDLDFSDNGILHYDIGEESGAYGVSVLENGVILATGYRRDETGKDTVILRLESSEDEITEIHLPEFDEASIDLGNEITEIMKISALQVEEGSFNFVPSDPDPEDGQEADLITTTLDGSDEESLAVVALADGTLYTAGSSGTDDDTAIMVAKYATDDQNESAEPAEPVETEPSDFYTIETLPVTDITRVGAMTGGRIMELNFDVEECLLACEDYCTIQTEDDIDDSETDDSTSNTETSTSTLESETDPTCEEECNLNCTIPTIEKRGVVFSVTTKPEYDPDGTTDSSDDGDDDEDDSTSLSSSSSGTDDSSTSNPLGTDSLLNLDDYLVTEGQTDDGDGGGEYTSEIEDVNPQTIYYVRAYALLSDGSVLYGEVREFRTLDSCFIATAAFGSIDGYAVQVLRHFRDRYMITTGWGQVAVGWYYKISPPIADLVAHSLPLRLLVILLLLPVVLWAWMMLNLELVFSGMLAAALLKGFNKRT